MRSHAIWLPLLCSLALSVVGCGDDEGGENPNGTGATNGAGATNGTGATNGNGTEACNEVCSSPCSSDVGGIPAEDVQECIDSCNMIGIYDECDSEVVAFIRCLEDNGCGGAGVANCQNQAIDFSQCFGGI